MNSKAVPILFADNVKEKDRNAVLAYISRLEERGVAPVLSVDHLSVFTGIRVAEIYSISNGVNKFYRDFKIRKGTGGYRSISAPLPLLLFLQRWILENIFEAIPLHPAAKAYRKGSSIKDNARFHRGQQVVLKLDVKDFFGSIGSKLVYDLFRELGYSKQVAAVLENVCTKDGSVPQGAATSGYISNVVLQKFDADIFEFVRSQGLRYTRYADDITLSGTVMNTDEAIKRVGAALASCGLGLNKSKTKILGQHNRQTVTGVVVNTRLGPGRDFIRELRKDIYYIEKHGIFGHARHTGSQSPRQSLANVIGRLTHAIFLLGGDKRLLEKKKTLEEISAQLAG